MSTPVRGGADGPLGYAPPRARQAGTSRANTALDSSNGSLPELADKPPRIVTSLRDDQDPALPRDQDSRDRDSVLGPRGAASLREALSSRDSLPPRDSSAPHESSSLRDALSSRDPLAALAPRDRLAPRESSPLRDALASRGSLSRDPLAPREGSLRDALSSRDSLTGRDALSRDAAALRSPPRDGLSARDPLTRDAASLRPSAPPRDGLAVRDTKPVRDAFSLLDPKALLDPAPQQGTHSGEMIPKAGPRSLLDEAADLGLTPSEETIARWETSPSTVSAAPSETPWKRKKRTLDVFEGDAALRELRTRLATAPTDQSPEPPIAPAKTPIFVSAARLMGVVSLAAGGALGFLWITSPQGPRLASPQVAATDGEVTRVLYNSPTTRSGAPSPVERTSEKPSAAGAPWSVAALTGDTAEKAVTPPVLPQPRTAGPPRPPVRSVIAPPPAQPAPAAVAPAPAPAVVAPAPPPSPAVAPAPVVTAPPMPSPTPVATQLDRDEINAMLVRARTFLSTGDVAAARVVLRRAALSDDPQAALALGGTYDPVVLKKLGVISLADPAQARQWYNRAAQLGATDASLRLEQMVQH